jgi:hypothetical protein
MPLYVWLALLVVVLASVAGIALLVTRALSLWRTFKAFGRAVDETLRGVESALGRFTDKSATLGSDLPRLEAHVARLRADLARLTVLRSAVQDARDAFGRILAVYPRK